MQRVSGSHIQDSSFSQRPHLGPQPTQVSRGHVQPLFKRPVMHAAASGKGRQPDPASDQAPIPTPSESNPRWRWPSSQPPPPPPPPMPQSFQDSPFDFWGNRLDDPRQGAGSSGRRGQPKQTSSDPEQQSDSESAPASPSWWQPRVQGIAKRLFQNPEIRKLAQAELEAREEDPSTATATRDRQPGRRPQGRGRGGGAGFVPPPDIDNITDARQYREEFADWIEFKREQRQKQRSQNQEDEIWGIARLYLIVSVAFIVIAFIGAR